VVQTDNLLAAPSTSLSAVRQITVAATEYNVDDGTLTIETDVPQLGLEALLAREAEDTLRVPTLIGPPQLSLG
jgi:hypothetical protein